MSIFYPRYESRSILASSDNKARRWLSALVIPLTLAVVINASCERPTKLSIEGGNPPRFVMTGSGSLRAIRVRGPRKQREAVGEDAYIYWRIRSEKARDVEDIGEVTYGKLPNGYVQIYPQEGEAPPLVEGERYYIRVDTANANGAEKYFILRNGKFESTDVN